MSKANGSLTKQEILGHKDDQPVRCDVPEWGGHVYVRVMSGDERDAWETWCLANRKPGPGGIKQTQQIRASLAASTICDKDGRSVFTLADINELGRKSGAALSRIFNLASKINVLNEGDVEELAGN